MSEKCKRPTSKPSSSAVPGHSAMQLKDVAVSFNGRVAVRDATFDVAKTG